MFDRIEQNTARLFWVFVALHVATWTLLPSLLNANVPLDIIEGISWGREWEWGYHKHPPLSRWLMKLAVLLSGSADWAQYLLAQICVAVAFWAIWQLAQAFLGKIESLLAVLLMAGIHFHNYSTPEFNPNVLQLPLWALLILAFWHALSKGHLLHWVLCGVLACLAMLAKYFTATLLVAMLLLAMLHPPFRERFRSPGPYLALAVFLIGLAPHIHWMVDSNFLTFDYALTRASPGSESWLNHVFYPLRFLLGIALVLVPVLFLLITLGRPKWRAPPQVGGDAKYLLFAIAFGPPILLVVLSAVTGWKIRSMWATPLFLLTGLVLVSWLLPDLSLRGLRRFAWAFGALFLLAPTAYFAVYALEPAILDKAKRTHFPGRELAEQVGDAWQSRFGSEPPVIIARSWYGGNASYYSAPSSPLRNSEIYLRADPRLAPWVDDEQVRKNGGVILWKIGVEGEAQLDRRTYILDGCGARFGPCEVQPPLVLEWQTWFPVPKILIGWAIVPPAGSGGTKARSEVPPN